MRDRRAVEDLAIEELEGVLRVRRREARLERLRQLGGEAEASGLDPLTTNPSEPQTPTLPTDYKRFRGEGVTASYRTQQVDAPSAEEVPTRPAHRIRWDWLRDKSLLVIELALIAGLVFVLSSSLETMQEINRASSQAQQLPELPTPTPTLVIPVVVLPVGHTSPDSPGGAMPVEIPVHLRDQVQAFTPVPAPTPGPEHAVRIQIPAIGVDAPVVEGDDWEALKQGAGHHIGSANPGERGNSVISAHNDIFGEIFRDLPDVDLGDEVLVYSVNQVFRYVVTQKRIVDPTEVSVMYPTSSPVLTLISCYPYRIDTHRIVVIAELKR